MKNRSTATAALGAWLLLASPLGASPRLEIGSLSRTLALPGLRACFVARPPGSSGPGFRFLTAGSTVYSVDLGGAFRPLLYRANLFGAVSDPAWGVLLCSSRGVYATHDGRYLHRLSSLIFPKMIAAPVGGLFAGLDTGLFGFDGRQFQLIRAIPWHTIDSLAVEPGGAIWFVGTYFRPDGTLAPKRLYVARVQDGQAVIDDPLSPAETASAVAEYFGQIVAAIDGHLRGSLDGGATWVTFDEFGRTDLTLATVPLYEGQPWQALWIGVLQSDGGPAPLWFDNYVSGLVDQPINAARVFQVTADLSRGLMLFVADDALYEAPYRVLQDLPGSPR